MGRINYRLNVSYRHTYRQWSVKIDSPGNGEWEPQDYVDWLDASKMEELTQEMNAWCVEAGVGKRMAWDEFMFKTEADATMFVLRFQK